MRIGIYAAALALTGCINLEAAQQRLTNALDSWVGKPIEVAMETMGYPTGELKAPNGNKVYVFAINSSVQMPSMTNSNFSTVGGNIYGSSITSGGGTYGLWCRTYIEVDDKNIVKTWQFEGNNCGMN